MMKQVSHNGCLENVRYLHDLSQKGILDTKLNLAKASVTERVSADVPHFPMCKKQFQTDVSLESHLWGHLGTDHPDSCVDDEHRRYRIFFGTKP